MKNAKVQFCGGFALVYDPTTNRDLFFINIPTSNTDARWQNWHARIVSDARKMGYTVATRPDGKVVIG